MRTILDLENWNRKEHFLFFKQFEEPFFGITTTIDCTNAYNKSKEIGAPFFIYYLHKTLAAVNKIEPFRYRIADEEIYIYKQINASATIMRKDFTFGFSMIEYHSDFDVFLKTASTEIERIQNTPGLFTREFQCDNLILFSAMEKRT